MSETVSTRVSEAMHDRIEDHANENDENVADIIRRLIESKFGEEDFPVDIVENFSSDLRGAWATKSEPSMESAEVEMGCRIPSKCDPVTVPKDGNIVRRFKRPLGVVNDQSYDKTNIQDAIFQDSGTVHVAGHGSSLCVAHWFVYRLQREGVPATAAGGRETTNAQISDDDVVIGVSRSGRTETLRELFDQVGATCIAVTRDHRRPLAEEADLLLPVPKIDEEVEEYASRSLLAQVLSLQEVIFDELPEYHELVRWSAVMEEFVESQFDDSSSEYSIDKSSQFAQITEEMENQGDLGLDPLIASTGSGQAYGHELGLKLTEFMHANVANEHASMVRDRGVNVLYREQAYLLSILPRSDERDGDAKEYWRQYLLEGQDSLRDLLGNTTVPRGEVSYKLVAMGWEDPDSQLVETIKQASVYGERAYLSLQPAQSHFSRLAGDSDSDEPAAATELPDAFLDLCTFTAIYLFVCAAFERRIENDRQLRKSVIKRVYSGETSGGDS